MEIVIKFADNFGASSKNIGHTNIDRKPLIEELRPWEFYQKSNVLDCTIFKNKHTNGRNANHARHQDKYGRKIRLAEQPQVGILWKAQDKRWRLPKRRVDRKRQVHQYMALDGPYIYL